MEVAPEEHAEAASGEQEGGCAEVEAEAELGLARLLSHVSATFLLFFCTTPLQLSQNSRKSS